MIKDPVCGMYINEEESAGSIIYQGKKYFFCAPGCKLSFVISPQKYIQQSSSDISAAAGTNDLSNTEKENDHENN